MIHHLIHSVQLDHPIIKIVLLGCGLLALLHGRALLRLLVGALLFITGSTICAAFMNPHLDALGLAATDPWLKVVFTLIVASLFVAATRVAIVERWIEVAIAGFLAVHVTSIIESDGSSHLSLPLAVSLIAAAILSRTALIAAVAAACFLLVLNPTSWSSPVVGTVSVLCGAVAWIRHGRLPAERISLLSKRAFGIQTADNDTVAVAAAFDSRHAATRWAQARESEGYAARVLAGIDRIAIAEIPPTRAALMQSFSSAYGLFATSPAVIDRADREIPQASVRIETTTDKCISLEEVVQRLRTDRRGKRLAGAGTNGEDVTVAIVDTGMELRPEYASRVVDRVSVVPAEPEPDDHSDCRHGSNAALIVASLAPRARFLSIKSFARNGAGQLGWILEGLALAVQRGVDVVNASFGGCHCRGANTCILCRAVNGMPQVVCASAGNSGPGTRTLSCPGAAKSAIATASCDRDGNISEFSSRGPSADPANPKPDVTAFGERVLLRTRSDGPNTIAMSGTSFSGPQVTAAAACILSAAREAGVSTDSAHVKTTIRRSARQDGLRSRDPNAVGAGMISLAEAVHLVRSSAQSRRRSFPRLYPIPARTAAAVALSLAGLWWLSHTPTFDFGGVPNLWVLAHTGAVDATVQAVQCGHDRP